MRSRHRHQHVFQRLRAYVLDHFRTLISSLGRLYRTPLATLMTLAVIGIALALPSGLYVLIKNLQVISGGWENTAKISLFLKQDTSTDTLHMLAKRLQTQTDITHVRIITAVDALREFREISGFGEALDEIRGETIRFGCDRIEGVERMGERHALGTLEKNRSDHQCRVRVARLCLQ